MQRVKNYGFWVSLAALIPIACQVFGITHMPNNYGDIVNAILTLLIAAGIVSNPTTQTKGYKDDPIVAVDPTNDATGK